MLRLKTPISQPVRNWWYDCPDGVRVIHSDPQALYHIARLHDVVVPFDVWYADMIHHVCLAIESDACTGDDEGQQRTERLTVAKLIGFIRAVLSVVTSLVKGEPIYVDQATADRRAFVCLPCKYNEQLHCIGCSGLMVLAHIFTQGREVKGQAKLGGCLVCGCYLTVATWCSKEVLARVSKGHKFPDHCWRNDP